MQAEPLQIIPKDGQIECLEIEKTLVLGYMV